MYDIILIEIKLCYMVNLCHKGDYMGNKSKTELSTHIADEMTWHRCWSTMTCSHLTK